MVKENIQSFRRRGQPEGSFGDSSIFFGRLPDRAEALDHHHHSKNLYSHSNTLLGTNISPPKICLKMILVFPRWDMLVLWRVVNSFEIRDLADGFAALKSSS